MAGIMPHARASQLTLLPEERPLEGFRYLPRLLTERGEAALIRKLEELDWQDVRMHGLVAKRRVAHFGLDYAYDNRAVVPTAPPPAFLRGVITQGAEALGVDRARIAEVLISKYPPGAGIGWHRDAPVFGDAVFGVSLGAPCVMKFRRKRAESFETIRVDLEPRSAYVISGPARWDWQHSIPGVDDLRYSITLRTLRS